MPADLVGRRVLVTGAAGFVGSHLTRRLVHDGADVHTLVRARGGRRLADVCTRVVEHEADVTDAAGVLSCITRVCPEVVFHLAGDTGTRRFASGDWSTLRRSVDVNLLGTLNVLRGALECTSVRSFLRAGGLEEYGNGTAPYEESQRERPVSPYSASQVAATHYCQVLQQHTETAVVTLRPTLVYGPDQATDFCIPGLILACLRDEEFAMSSGRQHRDLLYVEDAVDAFVAAAALDGLHGSIVNLGHGSAPPMSTVAEMIVTLVGQGRVRVGDRKDRGGEILNLVTSTDAARHLLDWKPAIGLHEGLERTVAWYRVHGDELTVI